MKITRRQLRGLVLEFVQEELTAYGSGVSTLMSNPNLIHDLIKRGVDVRAWFTQNIGKKLGTGSSRITYEISDSPDTVIKIALIKDKNSLSRNGIYANKMERQYFNTNSEFFPKIYAAANDNTWIIHERVKVFDDYTTKRKVLLSVFPSMGEMLNILQRYGVRDTLDESLEDHFIAVVFDRQLLLEPKNIDSPWVSVVSLYDILLDHYYLPDIFRERIAQEHPGLDEEVYDEEVTHLIEQLMDEINDVLSQDRKLRALQELVFGLQLEDLVGLGNMGTNEDMTKFYIIDIGLFPKQGRELI